MEQRYTDVVSRFLGTTERHVASREETAPLVIEPRKSASPGFLREFLSRHSAQILEDTSRHGALLLRGFDVNSAAAFEQQILSIQGMRAMRGFLFSDPGRALVDHAQFVFTTNAFIRTGGTMRFGMFHSENYFTPDVPRYVVFLCRTPSILGGETGLINLAKIYRDLPEATQRKLEDRNCLVSLFSLKVAATRYGVDEDHAAEFFRNAGLSIASIDGAMHVANYKPNVVLNPTTQERALLLNFGFIRGMEGPLLDAFRPDYRGMPWLLHRLFWASPPLQRMHGRFVMRNKAKQVKTEGATFFLGTSTPLAEAHTLTNTFSAEEIRLLGVLMRRHHSSFPWKAGDILIIDNLKMGHNGMPGFGRKRELNVMLCNPVSIAPSAASRGPHVVKDSENLRESLSTQLTGSNGLC
jgi:alpha-ketoglutarate-dependent taurine dioxygenase